MTEVIEHPDGDIKTPNAGLKGTLSAATCLALLFAFGVSFKIAKGGDGSPPPVQAVAPVVPTVASQAVVPAAPTQAATAEEQIKSLLSERDYIAEGMLRDLGDNLDLLLGDVICRRRDYFLDKATESLEREGIPVLTSLNGDLAYVIAKGREETLKRSRFDGDPESQAIARAIILDLFAVESALRATVLGDEQRCNGITPGLVWGEGDRLRIYISESQERLARGIKRSAP
ncbi:hypothetical protein [Roseofilum capinflatum]|uniref:Uncharacterized protein n=1 Tax=Roseofilum capinflatum BLCC-M114 TaxID=3022440 RepID=A0ABT7B8Q8_9CYAN|nr:hypothetical protein [Roseofilum capinflatum]MDJ1174891.1 hypothetical protein [Roseofilum capinflatum BLCC-M114]